MSSGSSSSGGADKIMPVELKSELSTSFMQYAMSTILGRALPDARDSSTTCTCWGSSQSPRIGRCARVVGEALGEAHRRTEDWYTSGGVACCGGKAYCGGGGM